MLDLLAKIKVFWTPLWPLYRHVPSVTSLLVSEGIAETTAPVG